MPPCRVHSCHDPNFKAGWVIPPSQVMPLSENADVLSDGLRSFGWLLRDGCAALTDNSASSHDLRATAWNYRLKC